MDHDKKAEVVHLFQQMAKGIDARPKPARRALSPARKGPVAATIIVGSTVVVVNDPVKTALVSRLLKLIGS